MTAPNSIPQLTDTSLRNEYKGSLTLPFTTLSEALAATPTDVPWMWESYVAEGAITLLAGVPKAGKSTLVCGLIVAILEGTPFLERETLQSGVLLLSEERQGTLADKDARWKMAEAGLHVLMSHDATGTAWADVMAQAVGYCRVHGIGCLVVDTFAAWSALMGESENAAGAVLEQLRPIQAAAAEGLAVIVIAHQRKSSGEFGEAVRGSNAITGAVDIIVELERPRGVDDETLRVLRAVSRYEATPGELVLALTDSGYVPRGDLVTAKAAVQRARVLACVNAAGRATAEDVADALDMSKQLARNYLAELYTAEEIGREGKGAKGSPFVFVSAAAESLVAETNPLWGEDA